MLKQALHQNRFALCAGSLHWLCTFFLEGYVFVASPLEQLGTYLLCRLLLLAGLVWFWGFVWNAAHKDRPERQYALYALPYLCVLLCWLFSRHSFVLVSDELNLFTRATKFDSFAYWFNYPSGFYWICCLMAAPHYMAPTFIKVGLQALVAGYCVARQARVTGKKTALLMYLPFLLPFVLEQGISAHRLPTYGMLYLFFLAKLFYDHLEKKTLTTPWLIVLSGICGILAVWRSEGLYLIPAGVILLICAYRLPWGKQLAKQLAIYALVLVLTLLPQLSAYANSEADVELRSKPLCGYALCNMFRNGLTEEMLQEERSSIEGYLKFSTIHEYNQIYGDENYSRAYVMAGVEEAPFPVQKEFCDAVVRVVLKHPQVYLRSQWNAWRYTSGQYVVDFSQGFQAFENLSSRVSIPCALVLVFWLLALLRRKWLVFWLCSCGLGNWVLVYLLMPAAYAKYFYVSYLMGYFFLIVALCVGMQRVWRRNEKAA